MSYCYNNNNKKNIKYILYFYKMNAFFEHMGMCAMYYDKFNSN